MTTAPAKNTSVFGTLSLAPRNGHSDPYQQPPPSRLYRLAELPADIRARLTRISELVESVGLLNVKEPHVRHIRGQLWEIRLKGKAGIARALYITAREQRVVILRAFIKKTEKTPPAEIELALQRAKELKP